MALVQTKTREGFVIVKNLLQQLIVSPTAAAKFFCSPV